MLVVFVFFFFTVNVVSAGEMYSTISVQKGDTFFSIAKNSGMTLEELKKLNKKRDYHIQIGEKLLVKKQKLDHNMNISAVQKKEAEKVGISKETEVEKEISRKNISIPNTRVSNDKNLKDRIEIINTFGKSGKYSDGVIIAGKPGEEFYSPLSGRIIYKGFLSSIGGDVIILEFNKKNKKLKAVFFNVDINYVKIDQNIKKGDFLGYIKCEDSMGVVVIISDDEVFIPLNKILND